MLGSVLSALKACLAFLLAMSMSSSWKHCMSSICLASCTFPLWPLSCPISCLVSSSTSWPCLLPQKSAASSQLIVVGMPLIRVLGMCLVLSLHRSLFVLYLWIIDSKRSGMHRNRNVVNRSKLESKSNQNQNGIFNLTGGTASPQTPTCIS